MNNKKVVAVVLTAALAVTTFAVNYNTTAGTSYVKNGKVTVALPDEPDSMDSSVLRYTHSILVSDHIEEGLTRPGKTSKPIAGVAKSWTHSKDYKTWTFNLRNNSKWSNGTKVTAKDFVFAWQRALNPATASPYSYQMYYIKNGQKINEKKAPVSSLGVKAVGDYKLVVTLEQPVTYFDSLTAFSVYLPINQAFYNKHKKTYAKEANQLLFNGPFKLTKWVHGSEMVLKKNTSYWNAKNIKLGEIDMPVIKESNTAAQKFFAKQLDMVGVKGTQRALFKSKGYKLSHYSDGACFYLEFNTKDKVFKNKNIRLAFSYAIDRNSFVKNVQKNDSDPATGYVVPGLPGVSKDFRTENGDLIGEKSNRSKAKSLFAKGLKELGLKKAPKIEFLTDDSDVGKEDAQAIQGMVKKNLGIQMDIRVKDTKAFNQDQLSGNFQIDFSGWGPDYNDPMTFLDVFVSGSGNNNTGYSNKTFDNLIKSAKNSSNATARMNDMKKAEKILMADMPIAPVFFRIRDYAVQSRLKGVKRSMFAPDPDLYWAYVTK